MNIRTLSVINRDNEVVNAALVCAFEVTTLQRSFLVYSLNENVGDDLTRIYLSAFISEQGVVKLTAASRDEARAATQALRTLFEDVAKGRSEPTNGVYVEVELEASEITSARIDAHHQLRVSQQWLLNLLNHTAGSAQGSPAQGNETAEGEQALLEIDDAPPGAVAFEVMHANEQPTSSQTLMARLPSISTDPTLELNYSFGNAHQRPAHTAPLSPPKVSIPDNISEQAKSQTLQKLEQGMRSVIANLKQKKNALDAFCAHLNDREQALLLRESALTEREAAVKTKDTEFAEGLLELATINQEFNQLFERFSIDHESQPE